MSVTNRKVLAVASTGGHWEQLMLLRETLDKFDTRYATTDARAARQRHIEDAVIVPDCNLDRPLATLWCALVSLWTVVRIRPQRIISTGAAPGLLMICAGRLVGAKTLWIDSVANGERLSLSGRLAMRISHQCLTQWEHLSHETGAGYAGAVL
ncbi:glucuronosyltransferase [Qipengyuania nanhaisediminis]|uniref:glucuronosyltransferase n=1 Tax=Qipengyuania nanhaisediminis TaxID=604088 RepID=UPI0038B3738A